MEEMGSCSGYAMIVMAEAGVRRLQALVMGVTWLVMEVEEMVSQRSTEEEAVVIGVGEGGRRGLRGSALDGWSSR